MQDKTTVIGLNIVHAASPDGVAVTLDDAISRPPEASANFLWGLFARASLAPFLQVVSWNRSRFPYSYETTELFVEMPREGRGGRWNEDDTLARLPYLDKSTPAAARKAFQVRLLKIAEDRYGRTLKVERAQESDTADGFAKAVLAFPECIAPAMVAAHVDVAVLPMRFKFAGCIAPTRSVAEIQANPITQPEDLHLDLNVSIVSKKALSGILKSIKTEFRDDREYYITDTEGKRQDLIKPALTRPIVKTYGRAGTTWRQGALHPSSATRPEDRL